MAIVFIEGFDNYGAAGTSCKTIMNTYWDSTSSAFDGVARAGRFTGLSMDLSSAAATTYTSTFVKNLADAGIYTMGFAHWKQNSAASPIGGFADASGGDWQVSLHSNASHQLIVYRGAPGAGTVLGTGSIIPAFNSWNYIEMKVGCHNTTGNVELRLNNVTIFSATGINTRNTANAQINRLCLAANAGNAGYWDDLYITNEITPNSGLLGDCRVQTLVPTGLGQNNGWSPTGQPTGWQCVDDTAAQVAGTYSDTDYVYASSTGIKFEYSMADLSGTSPVVFGIALSNVSKKGDAGARTCQNLLYTNSAEASGSAYNLSTSYANYTDVWNTNPVTGSSWTPTEINNIQAGQLIAT